MVARGAAYGDYDGDGDPDLLITVNNGPARLLRNDGGERSHRLRLQLAGTEVEPRRDRRVRARDARRRPVAVADGQDRIELLLAERAAADVRPRRPSRSVTKIEVKWPDGRVETLAGVPADQCDHGQEGKGITAKAPLGGAARSTR